MTAEVQVAQHLTSDFAAHEDRFRARCFEHNFTGTDGTDRLLAKNEAIRHNIAHHSQELR
jgi:hypothetical protein